MLGTYQYLLQDSYDETNGSFGPDGGGISLRYLHVVHNILCSVSLQLMGTGCICYPTSTLAWVYLRPTTTDSAPTTYYDWVMLHDRSSRVKQ